METFKEDMIMLLKGDPHLIHDWVNDANRQKILECVIAIIVGSGVYGVTIGLWRAPLQGFYVAIKFPLLILLTTCSNALLNGMLAMLYGTKISLKQSFLSVLVSFCIASIILCSLSPLTFFLVLSCPPMGSVDAEFSHHVVVLTDVSIIAFAGTVANLHLYRLIEVMSESKTKSKQILFSWLAGNLLLGAQLSWIMRPFIGTPLIPVEFFRDNALDSNFFEAVFNIIKSL